MFRKRDLLKQLDEVEARLKRVSDEASKLDDSLQEIAVTIRQWHQQLTDAESIMANYEKTTEAAVEKVWASTNAQAQRYMELKKRLDAYDVVFRQLGVFVQKQTV
jgi:predicted  nucleic acid-binding Zn-ribbon protein